MFDISMLFIKQFITIIPVILPLILVLNLASDMLWRDK